ncbi:MAG: outer-membrane lipoprotein carrier protein LolA [Pseudomonadota bacterium]
MLSSFVALAAGLIGGVDISPAATTTQVEVVATAPAAKSEADLTRTFAPPATTPEPKVIPVQETKETPPPIDPVPEDTQPPAQDMGNTPAASDETAEVTPAPETAAPIQRRADPSVLSVTERRAVLKSASDAMSRVETAKGRFVQVDTNGGLSEGEFFLQRPGRMRFDYDAPVPILIAADGVTVAMRDDELETVDRVPLASTPLGLLLDDNLDFETEADVIRVQRANGIVAITVVDPTDEAEGELTLIFNAGSYDLLAWRVLDANGGITTVELKDVSTGISLNPRLFIVEDFEDEDDDRRR